MNAFVLRSARLRAGCRGEVDDVAASALQQVSPSADLALGARRGGGAEVPGGPGPVAALDRRRAHWERVPTSPRTDVSLAGWLSRIRWLSAVAVVDQGELPFKASTIRCSGGRAMSVSARGRAAPRASKSWRAWGAAGDPAWREAIDMLATGSRGTGEPWLAEAEARRRAEASAALTGGGRSVHARLARSEARDAAVRAAGALERMVVEEESGGSRPRACAGERRPCGCARSGRGDSPHQRSRPASGLSQRQQYVYVQGRRRRRPSTVGSLSCRSAGALDRARKLTSGGIAVMEGSPRLGA